MTSQPGWYADPGAPEGSGRLRWWDGAAWTDHTQQWARQQQQVWPQQQQVWPQQQQVWPQQQGAGFHAAVPRTPDGVPLAGLGSRFGAKVLDWIVLAVLSFLAVLPVLGDAFDAASRYSELLAQPGSGVGPLDLYGDPAYQRFLLWSVVSSLLVSALYTVLMLRFFGATVGKLSVGMRVRRWEQPGQLSWGRCLGRWAMEFLPNQVTCGLWFLLDYLWCTWDPRRQSLHDKAAGTVVTDR